MTCAGVARQPHCTVCCPRWRSGRTCRSCWPASRSASSRRFGEPKRLARQLFGVTEGFFGPLFFVWLGHHCRCVSCRPPGAHHQHRPGWCRRCALHRPAHRSAICVGGLAAAQLGVPVAAATLGTEENLLRPGEPPHIAPRPHRDHRPDVGGRHRGEAGAGQRSGACRGVGDVGGFASVRIRAHAVFALECATQCEGGAIADLAGDGRDGGPA